MKRFRHLKFLLTTLLLLCATVAKAHDFEVGGIYYSILSEEDKTVEVTFKGTSSSAYSNEYTGSVVIPASVVYNNLTYSVTSIGEEAFLHCDVLKSVEFPNSVISIGNYAFWDCDWLTSVTIPNSVTSIGNYAFTGCDWLTSVVIGNSVTSIGDGAFSDCTGLTSIVIPNSVTSIGEWAFEGCSGLKEVHTSDLAAWCGIDFGSVDANPLKYAKNLYLNGELLTELVIPEGVSEIKDYAFFKCTGLTSITIPNSVTSIGNYAFEGTAWYDNQPNGIVYAGKVLYKYKGTMPNNTSITIEKGTLSITGYAFSDCTGLTSVVIGNSVTSIGDYAFYGCTGLKSVVNLSSLNITKGSTEYGYVGYYAEDISTSPFFFETIDGKVYLTEVVGMGTHIVIPDNYNGKGYIIGADVFKDCDNILSITIGTNVEGISTTAFDGCDNIAKIFWLPNTPPEGYENLSGKINYVANNKYVNLGNNVVVTQFLSSKFEVDGIVFIPTSLADRQCCVVDDVNDNLADIVIKDTVLYRNVALTVTDIMPYSFYKNDVLTTLTVNSKGNIGECAFYDNDAMTSVTLNNNGNIGEYAFYDNDAMNSVTLNNNGAVGESAFEGCKELNNIRIPSSVTSVGDYAFKGCEKLKNAIIGYRTTELPLGRKLFEDSSIDSLYIGGKITYLSEPSQKTSPFCESKSLRTVVITDVENEIYDFEFYNCSGLEKVTVGDGVESIGRWAFSGCHNLDEFIFGSNVSSIGEEAFSDCSKMTKITSRALLPPTCGEQALDDIDKWSCTLYAPERQYAEYQKADQWKEFLFLERYVTSDRYATFILDGKEYKTLLLTPGKRIIAPDVADREGVEFSGWNLEEFMTVPNPSPATVGARKAATRSSEPIVTKTEIDLAGNADAMLYTNAPCTNTQWGDEFKGWYVLFDDNADTFFHSEYGNKQTTDGLDHYIRVDMGEGDDLGVFEFTYTNRRDNGNDVMGVAPKTIIVEGCNSKNGTYTTIATLTNLSNKGSNVYTSGELGSDDIRYRYIRFRVTETFGSLKDNGHPVFAISELGISRIEYENTEEPEPEPEPEPELGIEPEFGLNEIVPIMPDRDIVIYGSFNITGIDDILVEGEKEEIIYDLQGRKITNPTNGIYIVGGKKVLIK